MVQELNLTEKRVLGASFFAAVHVLGELSDPKFRHMDSANHEQVAREYADRCAGPLQLAAHEEFRSEFSQAAEARILGLLMALKDIPEEEFNPNVVSEKLTNDAQYYIVSAMFDVAEARKFMSRDDMQGTPFQHVIPPRPEFLRS